MAHVLSLSSLVSTKDSTNHTKEFESGQALRVLSHSDSEQLLIK